MDVTVSVEWGSEEATVSSLAELDAVLDRVAAESDPDYPFTAIIARGEALMNISQGPGWSIVDFSYLNGDEPFHSSLGDRRAAGEVTVMFCGELTFVPRSQCIEPEKAREVTRHFYLTGGLSPAIWWAPNALWGDLDPRIPGVDVPVRVTWGDLYQGEQQQDVFITDLAALDALLDQIATESDPGQPTVVEVARGKARCWIGQGPGWSTLRCRTTLESGSNIEHTSLGDLNARGVVRVRTSTAQTTLPRWQCIEPALARDGLRHFVLTGGLSPALWWAASTLTEALDARLTAVEVPVRVGWGQPYQEVYVADLEELDALLDRIAAECESDQPTVADIMRGGAVCSVSEASTWAILMCSNLPHTNREFEHMSLGDSEAKGVVVAFYGGHWSELARWSCIEPGLAREGVRYFAMTGGLLPTIAWIPSTLQRQLDHLIIEE